jgi:outer membrane protein OmpA-like peptidoglycan-associated protein/type II secretory pathway pseudopilin PulG
MNTLKSLSVTLALAFVCSTAQAQLGRRLNNAVRNAAENAAVRQAERRTEDAVNRAIDDTFDNSNSNQQQSANAPTNTGNAGNAQAAASAQSLEMTYAKNDFVAGDVIFFEDDMANEKLGEFPSQWDLESGNAEIASINGEKCISLIGYTIINPLMSERNYLPDEFTIEFDIYGDVSKRDGIECEIGFNDDRVFVPRTWIYKDHIRLAASWYRPDGNGGSQDERINVNGGQWNHVSISFNKRALKYYINGVRYLNIPNMRQPTSFWLWARDGNYFIRNVRVARGAVPLYDRMMSEGKFITYGITFDVGKSTIKPESMGEINRIATLLKENPALKFSVEGHTDSTGNTASNQTLSEARSQAVVDKLVENGIAANRLKAAGKGQTSPIANNGTDEGRAKNRRVEFVKIT